MIIKLELKHHKNYSFLSKKTVSAPNIDSMTEICIIHYNRLSILKLTLNRAYLYIAPIFETLQAHSVVDFKFIAHFLRRQKVSKNQIPFENPLLG